MSQEDASIKSGNNRDLKNAREERLDEIARYLKTDGFAMQNERLNAEDIKGLARRLGFTPAQIDYKPGGES